MPCSTCTLRGRLLEVRRTFLPLILSILSISLPSSAPNSPYLYSLHSSLSPSIFTNTPPHHSVPTLHENRIQHSIPCIDLRSPIIDHLKDTLVVAPGINVSFCLVHVSSVEISQSVIGHTYISIGIKEGKEVVMDWISICKIARSGQIRKGKERKWIHVSYMNTS